MLVQHVLHAMDTEPFTSGAGKQHIFVTALWLSQPGFQHSSRGFGQGYAAFLAPLADYPHVSAGS